MTDSPDVPRLTFDPETGRVLELELTAVQYTALVGSERCPVVVRGTSERPAARCVEPLLLPCVRWTGHSDQVDYRTLTGDWLCAADHGPAAYVASLERPDTG
jgi:hypothetical protein